MAASGTRPFVLKWERPSIPLNLITRSFQKEIDKDRVNPRLGIIWSPVDGTTVRAALASTLKRPFVRGQTIEPTQAAGFNQYFTGFERFFGDPDGTVSERIGIALDQVISGSLKGGLELSKRQLEGRPAGRRLRLGRKDQRLPTFTKMFPAGAWQGAVLLDGDYEKIERAPEFTGAEGILDLETVRAPLAASFFHARGLDLRVAATFGVLKGAFLGVPRRCDLLEGRPRADCRCFSGVLAPETQGRNRGGGQQRIRRVRGLAGDRPSHPSCCHEATRILQDPGGVLVTTSVQQGRRPNMKTYRFQAAAFALISICAGASAPMCASAVERFYMIEVQGGPDGNNLVRLKAFY